MSAICPGCRDGVGCLFPVKCTVPQWTQQKAIVYAKLIEAIAPEFGAHVALTGGCLYKDGVRKDVDFLFYRIRQVADIDEPGLMAALKERLGILPRERYGWVQKAVLNGMKFDLFFPESKHNNQFPMRDGDERNPHYFDAPVPNEDLV